MLIATPISTLFKTAPDAERIIAASDCLECRDESAGSPYSRQYLFHFDLNILNKWSEEQRAYLAKVITEKKELELISFHLSSCYHDPVLLGGMFYPGRIVYSRGELLANAAENIAWLKELTGGTVGVAVENTNFYPTPAYRHITEADFIRDVVVLNNIGFLFDLSHAMITAHNTRQQYADYRDSLPLSSIVQVHASGFGVNADGIAVDEHGLPDSAAIREIKALSDRGPVKYLTIEYYKEAEGLIEALINIRQEINHEKKIS